MLLDHWLPLCCVRPGQRCVHKQKITEGLVWPCKIQTCIIHANCVVVLCLIITCGSICDMRKKLCIVREFSKEIKLIHHALRFRLCSAGRSSNALHQRLDRVSPPATQSSPKSTYTQTYIIPFIFVDSSMSRFNACRHIVLLTHASRVLTSQAMNICVFVLEHTRYDCV